MYQPLSGFHRPVIVDPQAANLTDVDVTVRCFPSDLITPLDASQLCDKVGALFEQQGARVRTGVGLGDLDEAGFAGPVDAASRLELQVELRSRRVHQANHPLSWVLCIGTFTLLPAVTESSFAQDVSIRDGTGFLLLTDTLEGRLVERFGFGTWAGNALLDPLREKENRLGGDAAQEDLSWDLYRQLSQLVFNAKIHGQVLQESLPPAAAPPPVVAP